MFTIPLIEDAGNLSSRGDGLNLKKACDYSDTQNEHLLGMSPKNQLTGRRRTKFYDRVFGQHNRPTARTTRSPERKKLQISHM